MPLVVESSTVVPSATAEPLAPFTATVIDDVPPQLTVLELAVTLTALAETVVFGQ